MQTEITVLYDRDKIIRGGKAYILKKHLQDLILSPIVLMIVLFWGYKTGTNSTIFGMAITFALFYFFAALYLYFLKPYQSANHWERAGLEKAIFKITERGIESESNVGASRFEWNTIKKYWFTQDFLIIIYKSGMHSSIPANDFSEELRSFIVSKIENA